MRLAHYHSDALTCFTMLSRIFSSTSDCARGEVLAEVSTSVGAEVERGDFVLFKGATLDDLVELLF